MHEYIASTGPLARRRLVRGAALFVLAAAAGCGQPTAAREQAAAVARLTRIPTGSEGADRRAIDEAKAAVRAMASTSGCGPGGCDALPLGAKPCGGPWEYVPFCPTTTDVARMREAARAVERAEAAFNERYGVGSTCDFVSPPAAGSCGAGSAAPGAKQVP